LAKGGKVADLKKQLSAIDMEMVKLKTQADGKTKEIKEEENKIKELERSAKEVSRTSSLILSKVMRIDLIYP